jgi:sucrose phosphorylase
LPFFTPINGSDAGFDPIDHTSVDSWLGTWDDVRSLAACVEVMAGFSKYLIRGLAA